MKLFIYCFRPFDERIYFEQLAKERNFSWDCTQEYPSLENAALAAGCDAISITVTEMNAALLSRFQELGVKSILCRSIGVDHVDLAAARRLGLHVAHVSYGPESVADYAVMLMLMGLRKMRQILDRAAVQDYSLKGKMGKSISACRVGVIGTGQIGGTVIRRLQSFGCELLACDVRENPSLAGLCRYVDLETLCRSCSVITLHAPAVPSNFHLIGRKEFQQMAPGTLLVNTARGSLVDTDALIEALERGRLWGAALDVIEDENGLYYFNRMGDCIPNPQMAQLRALPNVILTPHTAFYTEEVVRTMAEQTVQSMLDIGQGRENPLVLT